MNNLKQIRGQLRQIVKDILPEVINKEQHELLAKQIKDRLDLIEKDIKKTLHEINNRSKDTMGYLVRQASQNPLAPKEEDKNEKT